MKNRFANLKKALLIERELELASYQSLLQERSIQERISEGVTLYPVEFFDLTYNQFGDLVLEFNINENQSGSRFGSNGKCQLFNAHNNSIEDGIIIQYRGNKLKLKLNADETPDWLKDGKLGLNALCDTKSYDVQIKCLDKLLDLNHGLAHQFYNNATQTNSNHEYKQNDTLNESQHAAIRSIIYDTFKIIHGPPGTGKTKTLVAAIQLLIADGKKVLVAAPTNAAADHITQQLKLSGNAVLRYGNSYKINDRVINETIGFKILHHPEMAVVNRLSKEAEVVLKKIQRYVRNFGKEEQAERRQLKFELRELRKDIRSIERNIKKNILEKSTIICGTLIGLQHDDIVDLKFDTLVVDEAGQALEPAIWSLAQQVNQLILAGDPYQLPPTLFSNESIKLGLAVSLIEKGIELNQPTSLLTTQYRMNDRIMQFSNLKFYNGLLKSDNACANLKLANDNYEAVEFIDTAGCGMDEQKDENGGISNSGEIEIVRKRITELGEIDGQIGVISPYRNQIIQLQNNLPEFSGEIQTIDSFQGQERDSIVLSLVRSNPSGEIGFLKDYRRMNVAITRAKRKLIIVGDSATIGSDNFYSDLLTYIEKNGSYRSGWEYLT